MLFSKLAKDCAASVLNDELRTTGQVDIYTVTADGRQVAQVTDTSDFEDLADWGPSPRAA